MAKLTKQDILHVAKLAKLPLTDSEVDKFTSQLSSIINYMDELNEVDTSDVEPTSQTTGLENVFRNDEIIPNQIIPQDGYFKVDAILKERTGK